MKKVIILFGAVLIFTTLIFIQKVNFTSENLSLDELYYNSVVDSMLAEESEIYELVSIEKNNEMTNWKDDKVLLVTWHKYPESYPKGEEIELKYGSIWTFTDKEIDSWYDENNSEISDYNLRFNQLIGLPPNEDNTHFSAIWVDVNDVLRPAYFTDPKSSEMAISNENMDEEYKEWFDGNIINSYYSEWLYPWTRLGYTYDWAENSDDYGLTEFLVKENSKVSVEFTLTTEEFIKYLKEN